MINEGVGNVPGTYKFDLFLPLVQAYLSKERGQARMLGSGLLGTKGYLEDLAGQSPKYSQFALCEEKTNCLMMLNDMLNFYKVREKGKCKPRERSLEMSVTLSKTMKRKGN